MEDKSLVEQLEAINDPEEQKELLEKELKKDFKITRQQLRAQARRMAKIERHERKTEALKEGVPGGAAAVR